MTEPLSHLPPGRRMYVEARKLLKAKRRYWASKARPEQPGVVLQFRPRVNPPDSQLRESDL